MVRCPWPVFDDPLYLRYHDEEWGVPVHQDRTIFEFLVLEAFQAGLSWRTVLYKRPAFRKAFAGFDVERVARFGARDTARLMRNTRIIRNRQKILAAINPFTEEAVAWAKDLKRRGFGFLGPTVVYAHMQAVGMVNDHTVNCFRYRELGCGRQLLRRRDQ